MMSRRNIRAKLEEGKTDPDSMTATASRQQITQQKLLKICNDVQQATHSSEELIN